MRRDEPNRHGRAADALIASYLRELVEEAETGPGRAAPLPVAPGEPSAAVLASSSDIAAPRVEAAL